MKYTVPIIVVLICFVKGGLAMDNEQITLSQLLPDKVDSWRIVEQDEFYNPGNLYDYIDGGAELFLSYDFERAVHRIYSSSDQPDILLDVFDMGTSVNAFGVFTHSRESLNEDYGQGTEAGPGMLIFWQDRYYISILCYPETEQSQKAVIDIAKEIQENIKTKGPLPGILELLPQESLVKESVLYFRHPIWVNAHYFISNDNILHIQSNTDAVLAKYGIPECRYNLLLIKYPGKSDAATAFDDFTSAYQPLLRKNPFVQTKEGKWVGCRLVNNLLIIVFNAPKKNRAHNLIENVLKK